MTTPSSSQSDHLIELQKQLKIELEQSILLEESERNYWLLALPTLKITAIQGLLDILRASNSQVDQYIEKALSADQKEEHLKNLRADIARIKQHAFQLEEQSEAGIQSAEQENLLRKLDDL